jgi:hypothetical protein
MDLNPERWDALALIAGSICGPALRSYQSAQKRVNLQLWNETPSLPRFEDAALMGSSGPSMTNTICRNTDAWQPLPILKFSKIGCKPW